MESSSTNNPEMKSKSCVFIDDMRDWPPVLYGDIYNYLITSKAVDGQQMKNFKSLQSFNYFQSGNVGKVLHYICDNGNIMMKAEVRSSQTASRTNEVYVEIEKDGAIEKGWCSCMAGKSNTCSHVGAVLWKIEHAVRNNLTGKACTDDTATWNKGTTRNIEPRPLADIKFRKPKMGDNILEDETSETYVPPKREIPLHLSHTEYLAAVNGSSLKPLFNIKGTLLNKSFACTPMAKSDFQEDHTCHIDLNHVQNVLSFTKSTFFYKTTKLKTWGVELQHKATVCYGRMLESCGLQAVLSTKYQLRKQQMRQTLYVNTFIPNFREINSLCTDKNRR